ncbi:MAG TPA: 2-phosphosulfolactate phosphatase [Tepidisphaeraceae bacterium]
MPSVRVLSLPSLLTPDALTGRTAVVFDVLRATTTMAYAIAAGAEGVRVFGTLDNARAAAAAFDGPKCLAGELHTLRPPDFDLGNSPADFTVERCQNKTILMATTNGTRALVASQSAGTLLTGAVVNAAATATAVRRIGRPATFVCSGTQGELSLEDLIGCGAVLAHLPDAELENDTARLARIAWTAARDKLGDVFRETFSGHNLKRGGLISDVDVCGQLDSVAVACRVVPEAGVLVVRRWGD